MKNFEIKTKLSYEAVELCKFFAKICAGNNKKRFNIIYKTLCLFLIENCYGNSKG